MFFETKVEVGGMGGKVSGGFVGVGRKRSTKGKMTMRKIVS